MKQPGIKFSRTTFVLLLALSVIASSALAIEYVSVSDSNAILYETPSLKGKKLFVINRYTPLEKVVSLENWLKVRDSSGGMAWIEKRAVSEKQYVVVRATTANVRQEPDEKSPVLFQVSQNVAIESLGVNGGGWIKARHMDGSSGYIKSIEVWGAE